MKKGIKILVQLALVILINSQYITVSAQKTMVLDLKQTIALANDSSLEAFRTKNMYLSSYWE